MTKIGTDPIFKKWGLSLFLLSAGAATVLGYSPFDVFPVALAGFALLVHCWIGARSPREGFLHGFWFGLGLFGAGVSWVYVSMHRFGAMAAALAAFATLGFCAFLALFPALVGALQARPRVPAGARAALLIPAVWTLLEWLRGWILTGFPWLTAGYAAIDSPLAGTSHGSGNWAEAPAPARIVTRPNLRSANSHGDTAVRSANVRSLTRKPPAMPPAGVRRETCVHRLVSVVRGEMSRSARTRSWPPTVRNSRRISFIR